MVKTAGLATPAGFEPATSRLEGECSIQLSYGVGDGPRRLIAPLGRLRQSLRWRPVGSSADAVVAEIVGVAFHFRGARLRLDDRVVEPVLIGEGDRLLEAVETQLHLVQG